MFLIEACFTFAAWMRAPDIYISLSDEALLLGVQQTTVNGSRCGLKRPGTLTRGGDSRSKGSKECGAVSVAVEFRHTRRVPILFCLLRAVLPFCADHHRRASHNAVISYHSSPMIFAGFSRCRDEIF
jgi:hypothetical protein